MPQHFIATEECRREGGEEPRARWTSKRETLALEKGIGARPDSIYGVVRERLNS